MNIDLKNYSPQELLGIYASILKELQARKIVRSKNAPLGDYCEYLFCKAMNWEQKTNSQSGYDATDLKSGLRYQIKGRQPTKSNTSRQLSFFRNLPSKNFDYLAAVLFNEDFSIKRAALIPHVQVEAHAKYVKHANAWLFHLKDSIWDLEGVQDVTQALQTYLLQANN